jgi:hypothetical protein
MERNQFWTENFRPSASKIDLCVAKRYLAHYKTYAYSTLGYCAPAFVCRGFSSRSRLVPLALKTRWFVRYDLTCE